jgi:hypothetical protein
MAGMLELSDCEFKIIMLTMARTLMDKADREQTRTIEAEKWKP